ncbi:hypothetical protein MLD38_001384 [Melastoma candidum]|uniref:Uncharacterized protein n=1 Tax=Melastoma candidum TaxID=119954 RepID=A0ACB9SF18_9MYRT|nr:hypothetical protein MLD38_001384 [Melastoma candidum]
MLSYSSRYPTIAAFPRASSFLGLRIPRQTPRSDPAFLDCGTLCSSSSVTKPLSEGLSEVGSPKFGSFGDSLCHGSLVGRLQTCGRVKEVEKLHAEIVKWLGCSDVFVSNNLISGYVRYGRIREARKVFDEIPDFGRDLVTWTSMINGYVRVKAEEEAVRLFVDAVDRGVRPECKAYVCVLNLCSKRLDLVLGEQVHTSLVKYGRRNLMVDSAVVHLYAQCGDLEGAFRMFDRMYEHDVVSWTTIISGCSRSGCGREALSMFARMLSTGLLPNAHTVCSVLDACGEVGELKIGKQLHGRIAKGMVESDILVWTSLVDMYAKCEEMIKCRKVFDRMKRRNTVTWTSIIAGYARNGLGKEAIDLFREMMRTKTFANDMTFVSVLNACGLLKSRHLGAELHAAIIKKSIQMNIYLGSTLLWFYCNCGKYAAASNILHQMPYRDVVSWTAIISGCTNLGLEAEALKRLKEMMEEGISPNSFTYSSALKACARLEALLPGKLLHSSASKTSSSSSIYVGSSLIHMYARCSHVSDAVQVFERLTEQSLVTLTAMIMGYAKNGHSPEALELVNRLSREGVRLDDHVVSTVLSALTE